MRISQSVHQWMPSPLVPCPTVLGIAVLGVMSRVVYNAVATKYVAETMCPCCYIAFQSSMLISRHCDIMEI